jgi:hypothetical protein
MLQRAFNCTALYTCAFTAAVLVALATSSATGLSDVNLVETHLSRLTVVHKNQLRPSIGEIEANAPQRAGEAIGPDGVTFKRQGQWI